MQRLRFYIFDLTVLGPQMRRVVERRMNVRLMRNGQGYVCVVVDYADISFRTKSTWASVSCDGNLQQERSHKRKEG